jgi:DNA-binding protein H-NS
MARQPQTFLDLESLSIEELEAQAAHVKAVFEAKLNAQRAEVLARVRTEVQRYRFTAVELTAAGTKIDIPMGTVLVNPKDSTEYTAQKGRRPSWVVDHIEAGGTWQDLAKTKAKA